MERNKIIYGGQTLIDLTDATATASDILSGKTAYGADGSLLIGTNTNSEWTSGIYMDEDGCIHISPEAGAGGVIFEDGSIILSPNAGDNGSEWTSGIYMDEDGYIRVSPLAGAGGVIFEDGYLIFSPNAGDEQNVLGTKTITQNGTYTAEDDSLDGYSQVVVDVPTGSVQDEWVVLTSENLHDSASDIANTYISGITETSYNGWTSTDYIPVKANTIYLIKNHPGGQYNALYKSDKTGSVSGLVVPGNSNNGYSFIKTASDTAYIRMSEATAKVANIEIYETAIQMPTGNLAITANGNYTVSQYESVSVAVPTGSPSLQSKTITPSESQQTVTADSGYDGLSAVTVNAVSSTYIGSQIDRNDSTDLTASGATVTVPAGYYSEQASKAVASGSAGTPSASKGTVNNHSVTVTPSVTNTTGYITGGTKTGTAVTVSASELVSGSQTISANGTTDVTNLASVTVAIPFVTYYTGTTDPPSSLGSDGDIYLKVVS